MGQPVAVTVTRSHEPGRVRYELNRSLTGQEHENYESTPHRTETFGAVLAERLDPPSQRRLLRWWRQQPDPDPDLPSQVLRHRDGASAAWLLEHGVVGDAA